MGKTVGLKARYDITQGWDGGSDTADRSFTISGDENEVLYYVDGSNPVHEKPVIVPTEKRYLVLDYENPGLKRKRYYTTVLYMVIRICFSINRFYIRRWR